MVVSPTLSTLQLGFIVSGRDQPATGSERYYWDLLRTLPSLGVRVHGLVVGDPSAAERPLAEVESFSPEGGGALDRVRSLRRAVAQHIAASDVVASHHARHALPVLDLIRSRPLVVHFHGPLVREGRAEGVGLRNLLLRRVAESAVYARADRFVVLSRANGKTLVEDYGVAADRVRVVPGAVDLERFGIGGSRAEARRALGWPLDRPIVVAVRRLAATKGLEALIDAVGELRRAVPDVLVMLVGSGPLERDLRARVAERGLAEHVRFAGQIVAALPLAYRAADLSVVPSQALEGFGLVVVESLACGTPALVTPVTGLPEVVRDLDPALILAGSGPAELAAGLRDALTGRLPLPDERRCHAYAGRFAWPTVAGLIRDVYRELA